MLGHHDLRNIRRICHCNVVEFRIKYRSALPCQYMLYILSGKLLRTTAAQQHNHYYSKTMQAAAADAEGSNDDNKKRRSLVIY